MLVKFLSIIVACIKSYNKKIRIEKKVTLKKIQICDINIWYLFVTVV